MNEEKTEHDEEDKPSKRKGGFLVEERDKEIKKAPPSIENDILEGRSCQADLTIT